MRKLKICHIGWADSIHVQRLMQWLVCEEHDVSIITDHPKEIDGVKVYDLRRQSDDRPRWQRYKDFHFNVRWKWLYKINEIIRLRKLVTQISPDVIHAHSLWYPGYLGAYLKGYRFVVTVLNGDVLWKKNDVDFYTQWRTRWALKKADMITGVSRELVNACIKHGVKKDKAHVMRRGVDLTKFHYNGDKRVIRFQLGLPEEAKIVLSPRNTGSFYNLKNIVRTIPEVIRKINNVCFVFIWHSHDEVRVRKLKNLAQRLGVMPFVRFIGYVDHAKVAQYHQASDVMVSISQYDSGPVALQEAMACGNVPVISDLPSVKEWIVHDCNGMLVAPNNIAQIARSIIRLLEDEPMRMTFAQRNWQLMQEKGNQDFWMGKMEEMYYSVLGIKS